MGIDVILLLLGVVTGGIASITGFGIGSFITPVLALRSGFDVAVAAVGIAHLFGSGLRLWMLRRGINRTVLLRFGIVSAAGGLVGALLQGVLATTLLSVVFGGLMVLAGFSTLLGWAEKVRLKGIFAWVAGALSGFFGGLVGNQGGVRAAGLLGFKLRKVQYVATATAVAVVVDIFRVPVYIAFHAGELSSLLVEIIVVTVGVVIGTLLGAPLLRRLPEKRFKSILAGLLIIVGILVAVKL